MIGVVAGRLLDIVCRVLAGRAVGSKWTHRTIARASRRAHKAISQVVIAERAEFCFCACWKASVACSAGCWPVTGGALDFVVAPPVCRRITGLLCARTSGDTVGDGGGASPR